MRTYRKSNICLSLVFLLLAGCSKEPQMERLSASECGSSSVTLRFECETPQEAASRVADENAIRDINLWACGTDVGRNVHLYLPGGKTAAALTLIPDNYRFYAVANTGHDLGDMAEAALQTLAASFSGEPGDGAALPMAAASCASRERPRSPCACAASSRSSHCPSP